MSTIPAEAIGHLDVLNVGEGDLGAGPATPS